MPPHLVLRDIFKVCFLPREVRDSEWGERDSKGRHKKQKVKRQGDGDRWTSTRRRGSSAGEQGVLLAFCFCNKMSQVGKLYKT